MDDKNLSKICLIITIIGLIMLGISYKPEFETKKISELLEKENTKGIVFGRIDHVIKNGGPTIFIITDGNKATVFYSNALDIQKNDFVWVYAESRIYEDKNELYAYKVVR